MGVAVLLFFICLIASTVGSIVGAGGGVIIKPVLGGLAGKWMFEQVRHNFGSETLLGSIQAIALTIITIGVFLYVCNKDRLPSKHLTNPLAIAATGVGLGIISSFLGIGGGTSNVAVLFFFFSMEAKQAAKNSLYIIIFSQASSILTSVITSSVPQFAWLHLIFMMCGGVLSAFVGSAISKCIDNKGVEKMLKILLLIIIAIDLYNAVKYTLML